MQGTTCRIRPAPGLEHGGPKALRRKWMDVGSGTRKRSPAKGRGWQVVVQLQDGQYATVTQRDPPQVQVGDYVMIRNNVVYRY